MNYLRRLIDRDDPAQAKNLVLLVASGVLCLAVIILAGAACFGRETATALVAVVSGLVALAGAAVVKG